MHWNPVDLLLLAIVLVGAATGFSRGFLFAALDLLTLAASLAAAFLGYQQAGTWLGRAAPALGVWLAPLSFVALFLLVHFILGTAALRLARRLPDTVHRHPANRVLGIAPGLVNGAIHAVVAAVLLLTLPLGAHIGTWAQRSALAPRFATPAEWVEVRLAPDDVEGICSVYRPNGERSVLSGKVTVAPQCDPTPRGGYSPECQEKDTGCHVVSNSKLESGTLLLIAVTCIGLLRRRRSA